VLVVAIAIALPTLVTLTYFVLAASAPAWVQQTTYAVAKTIQFLLPVAWVTLVQKGRLRLWPSSSKGIGLGIVFGLAVAGATLGLYHVLRTQPFFTEAVGAIQQKISGMNLASPAVFVGVGIFYSLLHSLLEEYYWRWFVFGQLREIVAIRSAILISSLGFMAHHVLVIGSYFGYFSPATWLFSLAVALGGGVWAWLYQRTDSLVGPWISHLFVDAAIFTIGYLLAAPMFHPQ
jgi:membrane protease YdiL (CAAX protease family)